MLYKVLSADGSACNGGGGRWFLPKDNRPGKWMPLLPVAMCESGYHLVEAGGILDWITTDDNLIYCAEGKGKERVQGTKHCFAQARLVGKPLRWNAQIVRLFACDCAEHVLHIYERERPGDFRVRQAIEVSRRYAVGKATHTELVSARAVVRAAARAAAKDAVRAAARAAAWDAPWGAAWDTPWGAARDAAWDATGDAARVTEREWQTARLLQLLTGEVQP